MMKIKFLFFALLSMTFMIACSDNSDTLLPDKTVENEPVAYDAALFTTVSTEIKNIHFPSTPSVNELESRAGNCDNFIRAQQMLDELSETNCLGYGHNTIYCDYLTSFWVLDRYVAMFECDPTSFCEQCHNFIANGNDFVSDLIANGAHPIYVQSIQNKVDRLTIMCGNCPE